MQSTDSVLLIQPAAFGPNPSTSEDNVFQQEATNLSPAEIQSQALSEFMKFKEMLERNGVKVSCYLDDPQNPLSDSIFPNNWFSTHSEGILVLYPLKAKNRRLERRPHIISELKKRYAKVIDLTCLEKKNSFLESTGSLVLDRPGKIAYAALSQRTHAAALKEWKNALGYKVISFETDKINGCPIYHTNVLLSIGSQFAAVCLEAVKNDIDRSRVKDSLLASGKEIVEISKEQLFSFCANVLEIKSKDGKSLVAMSQTAYKALTKSQRQTISRFAGIIYTPIDTIERFGGGSARCMIGELF